MKPVPLLKPAPSVAPAPLVDTGPAVTDPSDEEVAAILAAVELCWPRPEPQAAPVADPPSRWRFSGRWWARPFTTGGR